MTQKEEQEANAFAMELLMPEEPFIAEVKKQQEKISKSQLNFHYIEGLPGKRVFNREEILIYRLSQKCQVSEDAVKTRMFNLGILTSI